jgi:excisionase family DNA binding protein
MKPKRKSNQTYRDLPLNSEVIADGQLILESADGVRTVIPSQLNKKMLFYLNGIINSGDETDEPFDKVISTQEAADYLDVSRQHVVNLIESGKIPAFKVGAHRRLYRQDIVLYAKKRDSARRNSLDRLFDSVAEAGLYDASYKGEG